MRQHTVMRGFTAAMLCLLSVAVFSLFSYILECVEICLTKIVDKMQKVIV